MIAILTVVVFVLLSLAWLIVPEVRAAKVRKANDSKYREGVTLYNSRRCDVDLEGLGPYRSPHGYDFSANKSEGPTEFTFDDAVSLCGPHDWMRSRHDPAYIVIVTQGNTGKPWKLTCNAGDVSEISPWVLQVISGKWEVRRVVSL